MCIYFGKVRQRERERKRERERESERVSERDILIYVYMYIFSLYLCLYMCILYIYQSTDLSKLYFNFLPIFPFLNAFPVKDFAGYCGVFYRVYIQLLFNKVYTAH